MTVSRSARSASWTAPSTWGRARNGYGSWMPSAPGRSRPLLEAAQQRPHLRGDRRLAGPVSGRVNPGIKRDRIRGGGLERQCGDSQPRLEQRLDVDDDQCGVTDAHGVARDEREPVARSERRRGQPEGGDCRSGVDELVALPHLTLAEKRERDVGERGQVAGPERPKLPRERGQVGVQRRDEGAEQPARDAGTANADLVRAGHHRRPDEPDRENAPGPAGVAAQQPPRVSRPFIGIDRAVTQGADAGRDAIDRLAGRDQLIKGAGRSGVALLRGGRELYGGALARDASDRSGIKGLSVKRDHEQPG